MADQTYAERMKAGVLRGWRKAQEILVSHISAHLSQRLIQLVTVVESPGFSA